MGQIDMGQNHYLSRHMCMSLVDLNPHHWASIPCKLLMIWPLFFKADAVRKKICIDTYLYSGHLNWAGNEGVKEPYWCVVLFRSCRSSSKFWLGSFGCFLASNLIIISNWQMGSPASWLVREDFLNGKANIIKFLFLDAKRKQS